MDRSPRRAEKKKGYSWFRWGMFLFLIAAGSRPFLMHPSASYFGTLDAESQVDASLTQFKSQIESPELSANGLFESNNDRHLETGVTPTTTVAEPPKPTAPYLTQTTGKLWENDNDMVHVIYSRFMQHQPNLLELGKARLELFKAFCLPTIAKQTNQQFLWIIRTDPELHPELKDELIKAIEGMPNIAVVGSNEVRKGSVDRGFRSPQATSDITKESLFYGDLKLIHSFHEATEGRTLLETNLDADDGLGLTFVERAQELTKSKFENIENKDGWINLCVGRHLEWQFYAPWDKNTDKGSLYLGSTHICVTPGLSWATQANARPKFTKEHHRLKKSTPSCDESKASFLGCWVEIPVPNPDTDAMAIRARSPTSTGMNRVVMSESDWKQEQEDTDKESWPLLEPSFAITQSMVKSSHQYLSDHLQDLVEENLKGQCTEDHSCSEGIKKKLKSLFFQGGKWQNKYDLVHIIHTFHPPSALAASKYFSFEAMESQTTYEYLWIIYVNVLSDLRLKNQILKRASKSPLNVLVVKSDGPSSADFRKQESIAGFSSETLLYGEMALLKDFHKAAQNRTILETWLAPNDGVMKTYMDDVQNQTALFVSATGDTSWYYHCVSPDYFEWRPLSPQGEETDNGFLKLADTPGEKCVDRPGTTRISAPEARIPDEYENGQAEKCPADPKTPRSGCFVQSVRRGGARAMLPGLVKTPIALELTQDEQLFLAQQQNSLRMELRESFNIYLDANRVKEVREKMLPNQDGQATSGNRDLNLNNGTEGVELLPNQDTQNVWHNDNDIVHVIYSRFMQHQPNLLQLGNARLELFKTFCLPTIANQTNKQFLWIIRADPELHQDLKNGLIQALNGLPNIAVVGSNEIRKGSIDKGFRSVKSISDITPQSLFYGDLALIKSYQAATEGRTVLETNLDADDGLALTFAESAQKLALRKFEIIPEENGWMNLCVGRHLEWQYYAAWDKNTDKGSLQFGSTHICVTPGLSWATQAKASPRFTIQHHMIKKMTQPCATTNNSFLGCWEEIPVPNPDTDVMAIRARTPTSTGMNGVKVSDSDTWNPKDKDADTKSWLLLEPSFAIPTKTVQASHKHLKDHMQDLVEENLRGQCTEDHSCSEGIKKKLKSLFFTSGKWVNKHDLVHVLHMDIPASFQIPKLFFGFDPVEAQTSYEFLWIMYVKDSIDKNSENELLKKLKKSPLNVLAVKCDHPSTADFRKGEAISSCFSNEASLLHGNMTLLEDFHKAAQNRTLLETYLAPNEAIAKTFIENIQNETVTYTSQKGGDPGWYYQCVSEYLEWRYLDPHGDETQHGFSTIASQPDEKCVDRPGTTRISVAGAVVPDSSTAVNATECASGKGVDRNGCFMSSGRREGARAMFPGFVKTPVSLNVSESKFQELQTIQRPMREELDSVFAIERYSLRKLCEALQADKLEASQK
eukprot:scaffold2334_cov118-Cylindrotheca_fusiformis.AAC.22